eukprot:613672-Prymnesium_polylepis.1
MAVTLDGPVARAGYIPATRLLGQELLDGRLADLLPLFWALGNAPQRSHQLIPLLCASLQPLGEVCHQAWEFAQYVEPLRIEREIRDRAGEHLQGDAVWPILRRGHDRVQR